MDMDFSIGTLLLWVLGFLALGLTCSLGFWARLRERAADRKREEQRLADLAAERREESGPAIG